MKFIYDFRYVQICLTVSNISSSKIQFTVELHSFKGQKNFFLDADFFEFHADRPKGPRPKKFSRQI